MKPLHLLAVLLISVASLHADSFTTLDGDTYNNATINRVEPDGLMITYPDGVVKLKFKKLPPEIGAKYGYSPSSAAHFEEVQRSNAVTAYQAAQKFYDPQMAEALKLSSNSLKHFQEELSPKQSNTATVDNSPASIAESPSKDVAASQGAANNTVTPEATGAVKVPSAATSPQTSSSSLFAPLLFRVESWLLNKSSLEDTRTSFIPVIFASIVSVIGLIAYSVWKHRNDAPVDNSSKMKLGLIGAALLIVGVFCPFLSVPIVGHINFFRNGDEDGIFILVFAAATIALTLLQRFNFLWLSGLGSMAILTLTFINLHDRLSDAKESIQDKLSGNPYAGLATAAVQSVQIEWGFAVLVVGAIFVLAAAAIPQNE